MSFEKAKSVNAKFEPYKEPKKGSKAKRVKRSLSAGLIAMFTIFVTGMADQYLGIYTFMMGGIAMLDRFSGGSLVNKDFYMNLGLLALACFAILKIGKAAGREGVYRKARKKQG